MSASFSLSKKPPTTLQLQLVDDGHGSHGDAQKKDAGILDFRVPNLEVPSPLFQTKVMERVETSSISTQGASNTGSSVHIGTAQFTGGGHAFGNNNIVNNILAVIRSSNGKFTDVERDLISDYVVDLTVLPDIDDNLKKISLTQSIINLPRAEAVFDDYQTKKKSGPCFQGTRVALLREMADWITDTSESRMYVLSGLAGIGKSTVAYTIASRTADLGLLGASFFFSRDEADRKNAKKFFTTIAYQLCIYDKAFAKAIGDVLLTERGSAATTKDPLEQLQMLILEPLRNIVQLRDRPILVVVDGLDECDEEDEYAVVMGLNQLVWLLPAFKVILTTRPQPLVNYLFRNRDDYKLFHLQGIEEKVVDSDIRLYFENRLSQEQVRTYLRNPNGQWSACDEEIDFLVKAAGRLFIIASTAVRYILDKTASDPEAQMTKFLHASNQDSRIPFRDLDEFYTLILRNVVPTKCENDIISRYKSVVGAILFVQQPLPVAALARLIDREEKEIRVVLDKLQSVILLDTDDIPRIYHKSFSDYITDSTRCHDVNLCFDDPRIHHTQIATCCFNIMNEHLKRNILGLGVPARFMDNKDGLKTEGITEKQLEKKIPQRLRYSCIYWANHFGLASIDDVDLMNGLVKFADEHILRWYEVLSLIERLDLAHVAIRAVLKLLKSTLLDLHQFLTDALRFISKFYEVVKRAALHTYYSALPFTPTSCLFYHRYIKEATDNIWGVDDGLEKWDTLIANLSHGERVAAIKFSLDNAMFVSCSEEHVDNRLDIQLRTYVRGILKSRDAVTGTPISTILGQRFAITNDFDTIASSEGNTITFFNVDGSARNTMFTTSSTIEKLAISSESNRVAAAMSNGTVCLWDSINAELIDRFDGFDGSICHRQLEFSPTGTRLAYSSAKDIVKLRDCIGGRLIGDLQCGSDPNWSFVFSSDGSRIACWSRDGHLSLWDAENARLIGGIASKGKKMEYLAISASGSLLATAAYLEKVTLWSEHGSKGQHRLRQIKVLDVHAHLMVFSLDNILAIATYFAIILYDVKTHSLISRLPFSRNPTALAFSPQCTRLAAGNNDGNVYLWDTQGIKASNPASKDQTTPVTALAFSRDCSRLVCGFDNGTVELWETVPTKRRMAFPRTWMEQGLGFGHFRRGHTKRVTTLEFSPDGGLFASGSGFSRSIKLWNGRDGAFYGTLQAPNKVRTLSASNIVVAAGCDGGVTLWSVGTRALIHTFERQNDFATAVSISENSALAATYFSTSRVICVLDIVHHTTMATFDVPDIVCKMTFLPDDLQVVAQLCDGAFSSLNYIEQNIIEDDRIKLEHLIQLRNISLWQGIPIWYDKAQHCLVALFSQDTTPVPVLWIPSDLRVWEWEIGSSMIALRCAEYGRVILLRLRTGHTG